MFVRAWPDRHGTILFQVSSPKLCVICAEGAEDGLDVTLDFMLDFTEKSGGLASDLNASSLAMCQACYDSVQKMKEARLAQRALIQKYESRYR